MYNRTKSEQILIENLAQSGLKPDQPRSKTGKPHKLCSGTQDIISNGIYTEICDTPGCPRRCGGQGHSVMTHFKEFNNF